MKSIFRATTPADQVALLHLFVRAFQNNASSGLLDPAVLFWKYWEPREDWDQPRSYVFENECGIIAHAGIWPAELPGSVRGMHMIDWCSSKNSPGAGLALLQKLTALFDFIYTIGGSDQASHILPRAGFVETTPIWTAARPLRPLRQMFTHQTMDWKLPARLIRNWLWSKSPAADTTGWVTVPMQPSELPSDIASGSKQLAPRSSAFFEFLARCPSLRYQFYGIVHEGRTEGYFALGVLRGQARVAGVWLRDPCPEGWRIAYALALEVALCIPEANEIAACGSMGPSRDAVVESGLRVISSTPVYLWSKKSRFTLPNDFQFQMSDNDAAFLDLGQSSYYT